VGAPTPARPRVRILNVDFDDITMDELLERTEGTIITVHVDSAAKVQKDRGFYDLVGQFDVVTCDSQILTWAAKWLGTPVQERVSGSDYLPRFYTKYADDPSITMFLCGAMPGIAEVAQQKINEKVGREMVVGTYSPPPGWYDDPDHIQRVIDMIDASGATVLIMGVAAGIQERFIIGHGPRLAHVKLLLPLGGTIDYEAGAVVRPPSWVTDAGLEWLWRLVREPKRRWRRYLLHQPPVLWHLLMQKLGRYRDPFG